MHPVENSLIVLSLLSHQSCREFIDRFIHKCFHDVISWWRMRLLIYITSSYHYKVCCYLYTNDHHFPLEFGYLSVKQGSCTVLSIPILFSLIYVGFDMKCVYLCHELPEKLHFLQTLPTLHDHCSLGVYIHATNIYL